MKLRMRLTKKGDVKRERVPRITAGQCEDQTSFVNGVRTMLSGCNSLNTRIYKTDREHRYCVCDSCGNTWSKVGPLANPLVDIVQDCYEMLARCDIVQTETDSREVVLIEVKAATELANRIVAVLP